MKRAFCIRLAAASLFILTTSCTSENSGMTQPEDQPDGGGVVDATVDTGGDIGDDATDGNDVSGDTDTQNGADADQSNLRTLPDYLRCESDLDCPVGQGSCIKAVPLNRPNTDETESRPIGQIFPTLGDDQGICTFTCSTGANVCDDLSVNGAQADAQPHTCQVVTLGEAPYPDSPPAFPFDDQLDTDEQINGRAFGAICRPPVQLDDAVADSFCAACDMPDGCAGDDALCWNAATGAPAAADESGTCLTTCDTDEACPIGFSCDVQDADGNAYCRPVADTCTKCQDRDDDGFGTGLCGTEDGHRFTADDCDDRNPNAYLDPANPEHAFPTFCGEFDYNCNGRSDRAEELGDQQYPVAHCTICFDDCQGQVPNGQAACQPTDQPTSQGASQSESAACLPDCDDGWADCDQDLENGCEVPIDDPSRVYFRDADGDGHGDPDDSKFSCQPGIAPDGYVESQDDCNDDSAAAYPRATTDVEICDGVDNDCDGEVDEVADLDQAGANCLSDLPGACEAGTYVCQGDAGFVCEPIIAAGEQPEICDLGVDNDCDGDIDEPWDPDSPENQGQDEPGDDTNYIQMYTDLDGDGFADDDTDDLLTESPNEMRYACASNPPAGFAPDQDDCDDGNADINPDATETCDTPDVDDNCDGLTADADTDGKITVYIDADGDHYGAEDSPTMYACSVADKRATKQGDCDDDNEDRNPDEKEMCDLVLGDFDNDCDPSTTGPNTDEDARTAYRDDDGDGDGDPDDSKKYCPGNPPEGYINDASPGDCADEDVDGNADISSDEPMDICDSHDNNCSGFNNEGCPVAGSTPAQRTGDINSKPRLGSEGSQVPFPFFCPPNEVLVGLDVRSGDYIDALSMRCHSLSVVANRDDPDDYTYSFTTGSGYTDTVTQIVDTAGGSQERHRCDNGDAIKKLKAGAGIYIDKLEFTCYEYVISDAGNPANISGSSSTDTMTMGGTGGSQQGPTQCTSGAVAVGLSVTQTDNLTSVQLLCQDIELLLREEP